MSSTRLAAGSPAIRMTGLLVPAGYASVVASRASSSNARPISSHLTCCMNTSQSALWMLSAGIALPGAALRLSPIHLRIVVPVSARIASSGAPGMACLTTRASSRHVSRASGMLLTVPRMLPVRAGM